MVQLQVGYHLLEGRRVPLKKPLAIIEKRQGSVADRAAPSSSGGGAPGAASGAVTGAVGFLGQGTDWDDEEMAATGHASADGCGGEEGGCRYEVSGG